MNILRKYTKEIDNTIELALAEDIGAGDITTDFLIPEKAEMKAVFMAKADGVICGIPIAKKVFQKLDKNIKFTAKKKEGMEIKSGEILATVKGKARAILTAERLALNFLQRLSGISTLTKKFVDIAKTYKVTILDTRKTIPNLRIIEKYAVQIGGGVNHRMGLYDAVLIKDNHLHQIDIEKAYVDMRRWVPKTMKIEVEVHDMGILEKVIKLNPDIIMFDNMTTEMLDRALARMKKSDCTSKIEVSGGIGLHNIREVARRRIDYISIGTLTHSPPALDISLKIL